MNIIIKTRYKCIPLIPENFEEAGAFLKAAIIPNGDKAGSPHLPDKDFIILFSNIKGGWTEFNEGDMLLIDNKNEWKIISKDVFSNLETEEY